jgi:lysylphosphatidylglycerol synthetase-like protein (DUF2156 family)
MNVMSLPGLHPSLSSTLWLRPTQESTQAQGAPSAQALVDALGSHAENPSAFLALNDGTEQFTLPGSDGFIAYRRSGRYLVQLGGPFAAEADRDRLLDGFLEHAARERRRVIGVQLMRRDIAKYAERGFIINQFGASYARSLDGFSLRGKPHMRLRNKLSRARRAGVEVSELGVDREVSPEISAELDGIDRQWLRAKGRHVKELTFLIGERGGRAGDFRRTFAAFAEGRVVGYVSFSPVHGARAGWLHDLSRRLPSAPPGTQDLIVAAAIERFQAEGVGWLHFGMTPFTGLDPANEHPTNSSRLAARIVRLLAERGEKIYPAADQLAYKMKWAPDVVEPEYVAFPGRVRLGAVWQLLRLTNSV